MNKAVLLFLIIIFPFLLNAQIFSKRFILPDKCHDFRLIPTSDSGFVAAVNTEDSVDRSNQIEILKIDLYGDTQWTTIIVPGDTSYCSVFDILATIDSGYILTGNWQYNMPGNNKRGIPVIKLDHSGNVLWNKFLIQSDSAGIFGSQTGLRIIPAIDGGFIITTGEVDSSFYPTYSSIIKIDSSGEFIWSKSYSAPSHNLNITRTSDSCYILQGLYRFQDSTAYFKVDINGNMLWEKKYIRGVNNDLNLTDGIIPNNVGGAYISIFSSLINLDQNGDTIWTKYFGYSPYFIHNSLVMDMNHNLIVAGKRPSSYLEYGLMKVDTSGHFIWCNTLSNLQASLSQLEITQNSLYLAGFATTHGIIFMKTDSTLNTTCVISDPIQDSLPQFYTGQIDSMTNTFQFSKSVFMYYPQNWTIRHGCQVTDLCTNLKVIEISEIENITAFPNPTNGIFQIESTEPVLKISIFDVVGKIIKEDSGNKNINLTNFSSGVYFCKVWVQTDQFKTIKIILN